MDGIGNGTEIVSGNENRATERVVVVLVTGGTMGSMADSEGAKRPVEGVIEQMVGYIKEKELVSRGTGIEVGTIIKKDGSKLIKDSTDMTPADQHDIAQFVKKVMERKAKGEGILGLVIVHGTDTLPWISTMLGVAVNTNMPVVITGAMKSVEQPNTDAYRNFRHAIMAVEGLADMGRNGTYVVFGRKIMDGLWVREEDPRTTLSAFDSFNKPVGIFEEDRLVFRNGNAQAYQQEEGAKPAMVLPMSDDVAVVFVTPSTIGKMHIDTIKSIKSKGMVVIGTHSGGVRWDLHDALRKVAEVIPVVSSAFIPGAEPGAYAVSNQLIEIGVIPGIGVCHLDHALLRAAVALGDERRSQSEIFEALRDRARLNKMHGTVHPHMLAKFGMDGYGAIVRARQLNEVLADAVRGLGIHKTRVRN